MSKRRISHQQSTRIKQKQTRYQDESLNHLTGLVIKRFNRGALIEDDAHVLHKCQIRPDIESLCAGDNIIWQKEDPNSGVILSVLPRKSVLSRQDKSASRAIAANISQIYIVVAPLPLLSLSLLDSYLVMSELLHLKANIVLNKTDLADPTLIKTMERIYNPLGYPLFLVSKDKAYPEALIESLKNETSIFVGQSGVGKSTLISTLLPHESDILTGDISDISKLGRQTTRNACLYHLPAGGRLIDSPGVREFAITDLTLRELTYGFVDIRKLVSECQFRDCNHEDSPGCGVKKALRASPELQARYESFLKLAAKLVK